MNNRPQNLTYAEAAVYNRLAEGDEPSGRLAAELPFSPPHTHLSLDRLVTRGLVRRLENGRYGVIAEEGGS